MKTKSKSVWFAGIEIALAPLPLAALALMVFQAGASPAVPIPESDTISAAHQVVGPGRFDLSALVAAAGR